MSDVIQLSASDAWPPPPTVEEAKHAVRDMRTDLSPRQVPEGWVMGLKAAGVPKVKTAQVYRNGHYQTLPLVIQFDCPFDHVNESKEGFAKVRLLVNVYTGWVSIHEDSCSRCSQQVIEAWLITCPRCAAGEDSSDHDPWHYGTGAAFSASDDDESPIAFVLEAMNFLFDGRPSEVLTERLGRGKKAISQAEWTEEKAREWLDNLVKEDGSFVVPVEVTYRDAWSIAKEIEGHPPKQFIEAGHRLRKAAGT